MNEKMIMSLMKAARAAGRLEHLLSVIETSTAASRDLQAKLKEELEKKESKKENQAICIRLELLEASVQKANKVIAAIKDDTMDIADTGTEDVLLVCLK